MDNDDDLSTGSLRRRARSLPNTHNQNTQKLVQLLGDYTPSNEKIMRTLGISAEVLRELAVRKLEEELEELRSKNTELSNSNKIEAQKALSMLGVNPSQKKAISVLGCGEQDYVEAEINHFEDKEKRIRKARLNQAKRNKKTALKALSTLGIDPSSTKASKVLGIEDDLVRGAAKEAEQEKWNVRERIISRQRSHSLNASKKQVKALTTLGVDPSTEKIQKTLGASPSEIEEALQEQWDLSEKRITKSRERSASLNKRSIRKALSTLGVDPSLEKVMGVLGVGLEDVAESERYHPPLPVGMALGELNGVKSVLPFWKGPLANHILPNTHILELSAQEASALRAVCKQMLGAGEVTENDHTIVKEIEEKIDETINRLLDDDDEESVGYKRGAYVSLNGVSPTDFVYGMISMDNPLDHETANQSSEAESPTALANQKSIAFLNETNNLLCVNTGKGALEQLIGSSLIYRELMKSSDINPRSSEYPCDLFIQRWQPLPPDKLFRAFISKGKLTGLSQYYHTIYFPSLERSKDQVENAVRKFVQAQKDKIPPSCALDLFVFGLNEVYITGLYSFQPAISTCLFSWESEEDQRVLTEGPFQFRVRRPKDSSDSTGSKSNSNPRRRSGSTPPLWRLDITRFANKASALSSKVLKYGFFDRSGGDA
eukprot:TRINITY_DN4930_c0_g1_i1.p1 TRINITY_DN4930_c0_g1~~TRINITY_DN4930_c0_g1_i1.p1  ORF type:complete len:659 (-),score=127.47 TRINITY_DN4930_c0_g1_i1:131-2107(-)